MASTVYKREINVDERKLKLWFSLGLHCPQPLDFSTQKSKRSERDRVGGGGGREASEGKMLPPPNPLASSVLRWRPVLSPFSPRAHWSKKHEKI